VALNEETDDEKYLPDAEKILDMFESGDLRGGTSDEMDHSSEENAHEEERLTSR